MAQLNLSNAAGLAIVAILLVAGAPLSAARAGRKLTAPTATTARTFMASLPLNISVSTPAELATSNSAYMVGVQDITVVFSRPVIALGSDFDSASVINKVPFKLSCKWPGKTRWVTTSIARYDPDDSWPSDLVCDLLWNTALKTYDGVKLQLGDVHPKVSLVSNGLYLSSYYVVSELAENITAGEWSSGANQPGDKDPEVPPDGRVVLQFSYTVNLQLLAQSLQLLEGLPQYGNATSPSPKLKFTVRPCLTPAPWVPVDDSSLDLNTTCADVEVGPSLKPDTWYTLRLPSGSKYNAVSGPIRRDLDVVIAGLRPFRIPFSHPIPTEEEKGSNALVSLRRWDVLLPHALAPSTSVSALASSFSVCELVPVSKTSAGGCQAVPFSLAVVKPTKARISVPGAQPGKTYRVYVAANPSVKDGFGQPLLASDTEFGMSYVGYAFAGPVGGANALSVLEGGGVDTLSDWPYLTRAPPPKAYAWPAGGFPRNISSFTVNALRDSDLSALFILMQRLVYYSSLSGVPLSQLGLPSSVVSVPSALTIPGSGADWSEVKVPLGTAPLQVLYACCTPQYEGYASGSGQILLRTTLSLAVVQTGPILVAWVTDAVQGGGSGPVAGAEVIYFALVYGGYYDRLDGSRAVPYKVATCTTNAQGTCTVQLPPSEQVSNQLGAVARVVSSGGAARVAVQPQAGWSNAPDSLPQYVATLAVDRKVVEPGDSVKITGFVQQASLSGLVPPPDSWVLLHVTPDFNSSSVYGGSAVSAVRLKAATGTFHGEVAVPTSARMMSYTIGAYLLPPSSDRDPATPPDLTNPLPVDAVYLATENVVVSSPRPPTAELLLVATPWVLYDGTVEVNLTAVSYIGASVGGSKITVVWSALIGYKSVAGVVEVVTDVEGFATARIELAGKVNVSEAQDPLTGSVSINGEWIGPTRERITKSASVTIAEGPARVTVAPSLDNIVPGTSFTVAAVVTSSIDGSELSGLPVAVTLRPRQGATCATTTTCATVSGTPWSGVAAASSQPCRLTLPCVGVFELEACTEVSYGSGTTRVCGSKELGQNSTAWAEKPLSSRPAPILTLDKPDGYRLGESPQLWFDNPWSNARLLIVWGTSYGVKTKVVTALPGGAPVSVSFGPLGSECVLGCSLTAVLDVPRAFPSGLPTLPPSNELRVATLFDPRAPHSVEMGQPIRVLADNVLPVNVAVTPVVGAGGSGAVTSVTDIQGQSLLVVEPGASAQVTVEVGSVPADGPVEVTVYAVDKAFLDLLPYSLPQPQLEMVLQLQTYIRTATLDQYRIAPGAVRAVYDKLIARLGGLDPWLPVETSVLPQAGLNTVDIPDELYLAMYTTNLGYSGWWWDKHNRGDAVLDSSAGMAPLAPSARAPPPPSMDSDSGSGKPEVGDVADGNNGDFYDDGNGNDAGSSGPDPETVRKEGSFIVTPLFAHALTGAGGRAAFNFTAPQNLGAFVIRAFATAGSKAKYGSAEGKLVVRRSLSLTPSVPPFVRVGDTFEAGVVVTVGSAPAGIIVGLQVNGSALKAVGPLVKTVNFTVTGGLQQEVRFKFSAKAVGTATLLFAASDGALNGARDALQLEIPVEGQQGDVWVATSFALASNASAAAANGTGWVEGIVLPSAVPGSGGLTLTAGVGYLPAIGQVYDNLKTSDSWRTEPYAQPAVLWTTQPAVLSYYDQSLTADQTSATLRGVSDLTALTDPYLGLQWTLPSRWNSWWPTRVDVYLNTWALSIVNFHSAEVPALPSTYPAGVRDGWTAVQDELVPVWRGAVEKQLVQDVVNARIYNFTYSDWSTLAWVRFALGAKWRPLPAAGADASTLYTLSLNYTLAAYRANSTRRQFDRQTRVVLSLVLLSLGKSNPEPGLVTSTVAEVVGALRVQGRTAYVAAGPGAAAAASLEEQAMSLLLLLRAGVKNQLVPKLAAYVASPTATSGGVYFYAPHTAQALALAALTEYDRSRGSSKPSLDIEAEVNGLTVLQAAFRANRTRPVTSTTAWETMPPPPKGKPSELDFAVSGTGEVTVAASLHFIPTVLPTFPTYRGLFLDLAVQLVNPITGQATGPRVSAVPLGSLVALTVQLTTPDDLGAVTLTLLMPGGLEPLDPNLVADAGSSCFIDWVGASSWRSFYPRWWWWPVCPIQETRPSAVTFSYAALRAGTSSIVVKAVAATAGTFVVPPVRASVDEQPEVMGMTAASTLVVCTTCSSATVAPPPRAPKPCPADCSDNGLCNLKTGVCVCDQGYTGPDCSTPAVVNKKLA